MTCKQWIVAGLASFFVLSAAADDTMQYTQKNLPNGDVETTYSSSDGSKVISLQHKDGSVETTSTAADGTKSTSIQHADGSVDTQVTTPKPQP